MPPSMAPLVHRGIKRIQYDGIFLGYVYEVNSYDLNLARKS